MSRRGIVPLDPARIDILERATAANLNWLGERFTLEQVRTLPEFRHYTLLVPERGDFALAAIDDTDIVGVVWLLFLPESDAGYGWLSAEVPELSLSVWPENRGRGWGRHLIREAIAEAARRGIARVSLSVEQGNVRAIGLYHSEGFVDVPQRCDDGVMVVDVAHRVATLEGPPPPARRASPRPPGHLSPAMPPHPPPAPPSPMAHKAPHTPASPERPHPPVHEPAPRRPKPRPPRQ